ncbi:hypothetical protein ACNHKD_12680 [Methylocystis sp. JAN1]|uniref:hypothetical protein n=1 Tax=Methylocystis sp. JAN1 TaxID=3397211 RepID=UPI003FA322E3
MEDDMSIRELNRRAIVAGLAASPVGGLPAALAAASAPSCPTLAAAREFQRLKQIETAAYAKYDEIFEALQAVRKEIGAVEIKGELVYGVWRLNAIRDYPGLPEAEYEAVRALLEPLQTAHDKAYDQSGYEEADAIATEAQEEAYQALIAAFETSPTSRAGALDLLRIAAEQIDEAYERGLSSDLEERFGPAMREAIAVLETAAKGGAS